MRIIGGRLKGLRLHPPSRLPVRPTTDLAKEALFNILHNRLDFDGLNVLDLFAGTGNITFELASRGARAVLAVDKHFRCVQYIRDTAKEMQEPGIQVVKQDVFKFIETSRDSFDFIFADPPYDLPSLPQLPEMIIRKRLLTRGGLLVIEHPSTRQLPAHDSFVETRKYGYSSFSFYRENNAS